jgi:hypothetical protein
MTIGEINTKISQLTGTDTSTNGYPAANRLIDINNWYQKIVSTMIYDAQDESDFDDQRNTTYPIKYVTFASGQRDYPIPVSEKVVALKRCDISWDGGATWYKAEPIDSTEIEKGMGRGSDTAAENTLDGNFDKTLPRYDSKYNSIFVYPRPTATDFANGALMKLEWQREVIPFTSAEVTTGTEVPGFDTAFHPMLAYGPSYEYAVTNNLPTAKGYGAILVDYEARLDRAYGKKQKDRELQLSGDISNYK